MFGFGTEKFHITMLGARGVGKTSLLSSLYNQFETINTQTDLTLIPDNFTSAKLGECLAELKTLTENFIITYGKGTEKAIEYLLSLSERGKKKSFSDLYFHDYPGGYIGVNATEDQRKIVENLLRKSECTLVAIDAPALMETDECGRIWHETVNCPQVITDLFKNVYTDNKKRLVILAPVKCEKYMNDGNDPQKLISRIEEEYQNLLNHLAAPNVRKNVTVVITPVQTVGTARFSHVSLNNNTPLYNFSLTEMAYKPQDCEQPLLWLLSFLLQQNLLNHPMPTFRKWMRGDSGIIGGINDLQSKLKIEPENGFKIIQEATTR